jgi:hypothetical protein
MATPDWRPNGGAPSRCPEVRQPHLLRHPRTGNRLCHGYELSRNGASTAKIKTRKVPDTSSARITEGPFVLRLQPEL